MNYDSAKLYLVLLFSRDPSRILWDEKSHRCFYKHFANVAKKKCIKQKHEKQLLDILLGGSKPNMGPFTKH